MKKELSIFQQNIYSNIVNGFAWSLYGIANLFDNLFCIILSLLFLAVAIISTLYVYLKKGEDDDEMSILHKCHAESETYHLIHAL